MEDGGEYISIVTLIEAYLLMRTVFLNAFHLLNTDLDLLFAEFSLEEMRLDKKEFQYQGRKL